MLPVIFLLVPPRIRNPNWLICDMISKCRASHSLLVIESSDCQWLSSEPHFFWIYLNIMEAGMLILVYWPLLSLKAQLTVTFLVVVSVLPDGLISSDTFASNTSYFHTDCIWTVMFIFYRGKLFFHIKVNFLQNCFFYSTKHRPLNHLPGWFFFLTVLPS